MRLRGGPRERKDLAEGREAAVEEAGRCGASEATDAGKW